MTGPSRIPRGPADGPARAPSEPPAAVDQPGEHASEKISAAISENISDKATLRRLLRARRAAIGAVDRQQFDARIAARVLAWWDQLAENMPAPAATLGVYQPLNGEADVAAAWLALAARGVQLVLPVVVDREAALGFAAWSPGEAMERDGMGVWVPRHLRMVAPPPALLVPCLGFDARGYRLGYGGGYYDRTLASSPRPRTAGIAYACQQARFATFPHDVALDVILTEEAA